MTDEEQPDLGNAVANAEAPEGTPEPEVELPDRWKDKSPAEIIKAHEELERKLGEQGRQLGEYKNAFEQTQSELAYSRQAPPAPQAPPPVENLDDQFFASPTKTIDQYFDKKLTEYDSYKRYTDGAREFPKTLAELKRQDPDIFNDDEIVNMTRQFVDYGLKSGQLDPMIQADPNLLTAIGVNMKYYRDKRNPSRTPVQPTATESPSAVKTNTPAAKTLDLTDKDKSLLNYFIDRVPDAGVTSMKDAAKLMSEDDEEESR